MSDRHEDREQQARELAEHQTRAEESSPSVDGEEDPTIMDSSGGPKLQGFVEKTDLFQQEIRNSYGADPVLTKIVETIDQHPAFKLKEGLLFTKNRNGQEVLCIPRKIMKDKSLTGSIIDQAHEVLGHFGPNKTADYIHRWYWWPKMGMEIDKFCRTCGTCQTTKSSTQRPMGLLHSLPIPGRPWGSIGMDFVGPFPISRGHDYLWVIVCRLTYKVHLVPINTTIKASELAWLYVKEVVRLHGHFRLPPIKGS